MLKTVFTLGFLAPLIVPAYAEDHGASKKRGHEEAAASEVVYQVAEKAHNSAPHWTYKGADGPKNWGNLSESFKTCKTGKAQSPIDLIDSGKLDAPELLFSYKTSPLELIDNGHTIKNSISGDNAVLLDGVVYDLLQFHYHTPSEHTVKGVKAPMEVHFVHQNKAGEYLAVGVMVEVGKENAEYAKVISYQPKIEKQSVKTKGISIDVNNLMNASMEKTGKRPYFHYMGSFTTPPCTENIKWFVMDKPIQLSKAQIKTLTAVHPGNCRPIQGLNQRTIKNS